tara:strand:+ start:694 stop:2136 length:1443 start_codon:yes stop_codon:yes gene_type:complete
VSKKINYIDLFCGAGGLSIGLAAAKFTLSYASDIDSKSILTFKKNIKQIHPETNPNMIIQGDIQELYKYLGTKRIYKNSIGLKTIKTGKEKVLLNQKQSISNKQIKTIKSIKELDLLCGGPPCQGFSMIGRAKHGTVKERANGFINDTRNNLFKYFLKFAEKYNPKIILIENVKGLASAANYKDLIVENILKTNPGYIVESHILNAKDFGIPQNRERLFFIAVRNDIYKKYKISPQKIFMDILKLKNNHSSVTVSEAIYDLPQIQCNPKKFNYKIEDEISFNNKNSFGMNISDINYKDLLYKPHSYIEKINSLANGKVPKKLFNHKSRYNNKRDKYIYMNLKEGKYLNHSDNYTALNGDGKNFNGIDYIKKTNKKGNKIPTGFSDKYFKLDSQSISKTIIAHLETDGNSYVHPAIEKNKNNLDFSRGITPREAARIQSFPDWYFFEGSFRNQYRQIGNAVPPLLAYEIGKIIKKHLMVCK